MRMQENQNFGYIQGTQIRTQLTGTNFQMLSRVPENQDTQHNTKILTPKETSKFRTSTETPKYRTLETRC